MSFVRMIRNALSIAVVFFLVGQPVWARPFRELVTFEQFEDLIKAKVREVPELDRLWSEMSRGEYRIRGRPAVTFAGGAFRGLLVWLNGNLERYPLRTVMGMRPPRVKDLLLQAGADLDLIAHPSFVKRLERTIDYRNWDVIDTDFWVQSMSSGGPGIDRITANPWEIRDPFGELRKFYDGSLNYYLGRAESLKGNTDVAMALRFLRFERELRSVAKASPQSIEAIREKVRGVTLPENTHGDYHDGHSIRYWVKKALKKFMDAYGKDQLGAMLKLKETGLLEPLGKSKMPLFGVTPQFLDQNFNRLVEAGFTREEMLYLDEMASWYGGGRNPFKARLAQWQQQQVDSPKEDLPKPAQPEKTEEVRARPAPKAEDPRPIEERIASAKGRAETMALFRELTESRKLDRPDLIRYHDHLVANGARFEDLLELARISSLGVGPTRYAFWSHLVEKAHSQDQLKQLAEKIREADSPLIDRMMARWDALPGNHSIADLMVRLAESSVVDHTNLDAHLKHAHELGASFDDLVRVVSSVQGRDRVRGNLWASVLPYAVSKSEIRKAVDAALRIDDRLALVLLDQWKEASGNEPLSAFREALLSKATPRAESCIRFYQVRLKELADPR